MNFKTVIESEFIFEMYGIRKHVVHEFTLIVVIMAHENT